MTRLYAATGDGIARVDEVGEAWTAELFLSGSAVQCRAADAAEAAFPAWSALGAYERREIFLRAADVMANRREEAITALAQETGASRLFSELNVAVSVQVLREAAAAITRPMGELLPTSIPGAYSIAQRVPFGVVGAISPWNAPLVLGMRSIASSS
jgi:vanillin dehydrogenase